jgi:ATP-dependent DNA helicase RecG
VGLLHGRVSADEKEETMRAFKNHEHHMLVATTVVEVGIDIPNATCMVVEHPERFGLSQLHQLRGRIGSGKKSSLCILMTSQKQTDDSKRRIQIMEKTTDGFKIAEEDLSIRGPGEFLGTRQSGLPDLRFANLVRDVPILSEAREAAFQIIEDDPALSSQPQFRDVIRQRWKEKLELAEVG